MESATFRKWLVEQGCRIDGDEHPRGARRSRHGDGASRGPKDSRPAGRLAPGSRPTRGAPGLR